MEKLKRNKSVKSIEIIDNNRSSFIKDTKQKLKSKKYLSKQNSCLTIFQTKKLKNSNSQSLYYSQYQSSTNRTKKHFKKNISSLSVSEMDDLKNDIFTVYNTIQKNRESYKNYNSKVRKTEKSNLNYSTTILSKNITKNNNNKFEKYDKANMAYEIYHDYNKLSFNGFNIPFIKKMELYNLKRCLKDAEIDKYLKIKSPKLPEKKIVQTFNRLIEDSNRRYFCIANKEKRKKEIENLEKKKNNNLNTKRKKNAIEVSERLYPKPNKKIPISNKNIINEDNKNENENKIKNDKPNEKKSTLKKSKSLSNIKQINEITNRLYYQQINKKDFGYKLFLEKIQQLNENANNDCYSKKNDDIMTFEELVQLRKSNKNKNINKQQKSNIYGNQEKSSMVYKFNDDSFEDANTNYKTISNNFLSTNKSRTSQRTTYNREFQSNDNKIDENNVPIKINDKNNFEDNNIDILSNMGINENYLQIFQQNRK